MSYRHKTGHFLPSNNTPHTKSMRPWLRKATRAASHIYAGISPSGKKSINLLLSFSHWTLNLDRMRNVTGEKPLLSLVAFGKQYKSLCYDYAIPAARS